MLSDRTPKRGAGWSIPPFSPKAWDALTETMARNQALAFGTSFEEEYEGLVRRGYARKRQSFLGRIRGILRKVRTL